MIDPKHTQIAGIIDLGDITIGDLSSDFGFLWKYGKEFIDMIFEDFEADV